MPCGLFAGRAEVAEGGNGVHFGEEAVVYVADVAAAAGFAGQERIPVGLHLDVAPVPKQQAQASGREAPVVARWVGQVGPIG